MKNVQKITQKTMAKMNLEILLRSVTEWNETRQANPDFTVDFSKKELKGLNLYGADLRGAKLNATNFSGSNLSKATFNGARLNGANLSGADLRKTDFSDAKLSGANLSGVDLSSADLRGADLSMTDLSRAKLKGTNLTEARLNGANLSEADLREAKLNWADLSGAGMSMANLSEADLSDAKLCDADLIGADLSDTDLSEADLRDADLRDAKLSMADLHDANLSDADLSEAEMSDADLGEADLRDAKLRWTNLSRATLCGADLSMAILCGADLSEANLCGADMTGANLCDANISGADLSMVNLSGADLGMANFSKAELCYTNFTNLDLSKVKGLNDVGHRGPSEISISTLFKSRGRISDAFLRGCGVSDTFIEYIRSLAGKAIAHYSCFISFSSRDRGFAERLHADLQSNGIRCWYTPDNQKISDYLDDKIDHAIRSHEKCLLILSDNSMNSEWIKSEIIKTIKREEKEGKRILYPISLVRSNKIEEWDFIDRESGRNLARELRKYFIPCFSGWEHDNEVYTTEFKRLLEFFIAGNGV
jgi:uncharacterized protein YjbI with pentapeptide repeats